MYNLQMIYRVTDVGIIFLPEIYGMIFSLFVLFMYGQTLGAGWQFPDHPIGYIMTGLFIGSFISFVISIIRLGGI